jgi:CRISPR type III-A-associated protein Csm2
MEDETQGEATQTVVEPAIEVAPAVKEEPAKQETAKPEGIAPPRREDRPPKDEKGPKGDRREARPPRPGGERPGGDRPAGSRPPEGNRGDRPHEGSRGDRTFDRNRGDRPGGGRPFEGPPDIELEKLISDSLYLDNQAHAIVARMRDMDSGTKSQLRRLYNAVRRAVRAPENEKQHQFVMLRARLAYTIARHSLRSLDALERLLLQVTRRNDAHGYERFKDLFEAIVAYNE